MNLKEFTAISIENFKGLYKRGMADQCPPDHAICCQNVKFTNTGEVAKRDGIKISLALNHKVKKQYLATFGPGADFRMITLDDAGNLYQGSNTTPIFTLAGMFDFHLLSLFNKVFILPITNLFPAPLLQVWDGVNLVRNAAGLAPTVTFTAADGAADPTGGLDPGVHQFAVCYLTNTGFTTQPGPKIATVFTPVLYTAPGGLKVVLSGIPIGPSPQTVGRVILATKANETLFFFVPGGSINDNTTTALTLDFFDTSLAVSADYLFDQLETVTTQDPTGSGAGMLSVYHARLVMASGKITRLSRAQNPESFDNVVGYINTPQWPVQDAVSCFVLRDALYIGLGVGLYVTQDNLGDPGTWDVVIVDGALTAYKDAIGTISSHIPALGISEVTVLANREGMFIFDGVVRRPELSWKIKDIWDTITHGQARNIMISIDFYSKVIYVLLPVNGSLVPNVLLMADYSEMDAAQAFGPPGISKSNIKWTYHFFPFVPYSIGMASFFDIDGMADGDYYLRIGSQTDNSLFKLKAGLTDDNGTAIDSRYCCYLATVEKGAVNIFRALRFRNRGPGDLEIRLAAEDFIQIANPPSFVAVPLNPGQDNLRQINFMNEKMSVQFRNNELASGFQVDRVDIFAKRIFAARPQ